jgi:hypothetical protein
MNQHLMKMAKMPKMMKMIKKVEWVKQGLRLGANLKSSKKVLIRGSCSAMSS